MTKLKVGILGATGMVGQRFITLLQNHPWFEVVCVAASPRSAGQAYAAAVASRWLMTEPVPTDIRDLKVLDVSADIEAISKQVDMVFCALDMEKSAIRDIEDAYAAAGVPVVSNNSAHRWTPDVPMIIPEVNSAHLEMIDIQRKNRDWTTGFVAVKPNCSIQSYTIVLSALRELGLVDVSVTSLQAISGAGKTFATWPEMTDNIIPFIDGEEDKSENEPLKIWGAIEGKVLEPAASPNISATCIRVPVSNGHTASVAVQFKTKTSITEIVTVLEAFESPLADLKLPSSPQRLIHYFDDPNRPQTALDRNTEQGMSVSIGRLREIDPYNWRFVSLAHNTIRGAAGGAILMAELLVSKGYIKQ